MRWFLGLISYVSITLALSGDAEQRKRSAIFHANARFVYRTSFYYVPPLSARVILLNTNGPCSSRPVCKGNAQSAPPLRFLFLFFLYFEDFAAFVKSAVGTNRVRKTHRTAVGAGGQVAGLQGIVRAAIVAAAL